MLGIIKQEYRSYSSDRRADLNPPGPRDSALDPLPTILSIRRASAPTTPARTLRAALQWGGRGSMKATARATIELVVHHRGEVADTEPAGPGWRMPVDDLFA